MPTSERFPPPGGSLPPLLQGSRKKPWDKVGSRVGFPIRPMGLSLENYFLGQWALARNYFLGNGP